MVLKVGERADAARQLDKDCPGRRWEMNIWHPAAPGGECAAKNCKQDESQVEQEDAVSHNTKIHKDIDKRVHAKRARGKRDRFGPIPA